MHTMTYKVFLVGNEITDSQSHVFFYLQKDTGPLGNLSFYNVVCSSQNRMICL